MTPTPEKITFKKPSLIWVKGMLKMYFMCQSCEVIHYLIQYGFIQFCIFYLVFSSFIQCFLSLLFVLCFKFNVTYVGATWSACFFCLFFFHFTISNVYTYLYVNRLYISLYINLYIYYINSSVYILIYILRNNTFCYCAKTIYIPFILFKSNRV